MATYITVDDVVFSEGDTTAVFNVRIHSDGTPAAAPFDITYAGQDGVSIGGVNFDLPASTVTIGPGDTTASITVNLPAVANIGNLFAGFQLQLSSVAADVLFSNNLVTATLVESSAATVALPVMTPGDVVVDESAGIATVYVTLDAPSASAVTVAYTTQNANATAGADYTTTSGTLTIAAGEMVGSFVIPITADSVIEGRELISVLLTSPSGATLSDDLVHVIIQDSSAALEASPTINVQGATVGENQGYVDFLVTLSAPSAADVTVQYSTTDGTALALDPGIATNDYVGVTAGSLTFAPGEVSKVVRILINDNSAVDATVLRSFTLGLSTASGGVLGTATATATLIDNEATVGNINHTASANGDILAGTVYGDSMQGGSGDDVLDGRAASDTMRGGAGNDIYIVEQDGGLVDEFVGFTAVDAGGNDTIITYRNNTTISTNVENMILGGSAAMGDGFSYGYGNASNNLIVGNSLRNWLEGRVGNDTLDGGVGNDTMYGGTGDDTYYVDHAGDAPCEYVGEGTDTVISSVDHRLGQNLTPDNVGVLDFLENLVLTGTANLTGTGNSLANHITGNDGNNRLDGAGGIDTLVGGLGDDTYVVDNTADVITENAGEGTETVEASASYTLGAELENLTLTGTGNINGTGNTGANTVTGNSGNNRLDGGAGADTLIGGAGNDTYVYDALDTITDTSGASDTLEIGQTYTVGTLGISGIENITLTGITDIDATGDANANVLTGNAGLNDLTGLGGNDTLDGLGGADNLIGGQGDDSYVYDAADTITEIAGQGSDTILTAASHVLATANVENVTLTGSANVDATGDAGANRLTGNGGNNRLDGLAGVDTLVGGAGNDTYVVDSSDTVTELAAEGTDTVEASVTHTLSANVENLVLTGVAAIDGTGNALNNVITGNAEANTLTGGGGVDSLIGGAGNDTYHLDVRADVVTEAEGAGIDTVHTAVSRSLDANVENMVLTGTAAVGNGNALNNVITGNALANSLNGGAGSDTLIGGDGNDVYVLDVRADVVTESAGGGIDTIYTDVNRTLDDNVENLVLTGTATVANGNSANNAITGNALANTISGGAGLDSMAGGLGNDTYYVDVAGDVVTEVAGAGTDTVYTDASRTLDANVENLVLTGAATVGTGNVLNNVITGNALANTLTGGAGVDSLIGGAGNDTYHLDVRADVVTEAEGAGTDTIHTAANRTLDANVENMVLTGTAIVGNGNALNNVITGNAVANSLNGGAGSDTLIGGEGDDVYVLDVRADVVTESAGGGIDTVYTDVNRTLDDNVENLVLTGTATVANGNSANNAITGNALANTISGGAGLDSMAGGLGNDTYYVDVAGDVVTEVAGAGTDTVYTDASRTLDANVENLVLTGAATVGTGNVLNNVITGNALANTLTGGAGVDSLIGGAGNDTYHLDVRADVVTEAAGAGTDTVYTDVNRTLDDNVENMVLSGTASVGNGNVLDNLLTGNSLANTLSGGAGNDTLSGGAGVDTLYGGIGNDVFLFASADGAGNSDNVADFVSGVDKVSLDDVFFNTLGLPGVLDAAQLRVGAGLTAATGAEHLVFNTSTGALYYDADGSGGAAAMQVATLNGLTGLLATDILIS
ncbi:beta strand repeat-containing protein [Sphaerotilus mobilis]|uniref:Hemolysin type calcium-binding protein n=1 Tax=Sphaerotilus mobilis TaxID=47994 RepID=A0A4Q7LBM2_9BURK|nr:Calx-beta domain-containing protein [Sphaerotilus mobilis]RZS47476.1 hemolysin type calcium-binding protein [Sphaerotilus mobilis]